MQSKLPSAPVPRPRSRTARSRAAGTALALALLSCHCSFPDYEFSPSEAPAGASGAFGAAGAPGRAGSAGGANGTVGAVDTPSGGGAAGAAGGPADCLPDCPEYEVAATVTAIGDFLADAERMYWVELDDEGKGAALRVSSAKGGTGSATLRRWDGLRPANAFVDGVDGDAVVFYSDVDGIVSLAADGTFSSEIVPSALLPVGTIEGFRLGRTKLFYLARGAGQSQSLVQVDVGGDEATREGPADDFQELLDVEGDEAITYDGDGHIFRVSLRAPGAEPSRDDLVPGLSELGLDLYECAHDDGAYYLLADTNVLKVPRGPGPARPQALASDEVEPTNVRAGGEYVYWLASQGDGAVVRRVRKDGTSAAAETLAAGASPFALEFAAGRVFWLSADGKSLRGRRQP
jgi:hypothetical protein